MSFLIEGEEGGRGDGHLFLNVLLVGVELNSSLGDLDKASSCWELVL